MKAREVLCGDLRHDFSFMISTTDPGSFLFTLEGLAKGDTAFRTFIFDAHLDRECCSGI